MIRYKTGDLLASKAEALVNTVNTIGVMGKGIALQFKERFPMNFRLYVEACKNHRIDIGKLLVVKELLIDKEQYIINFPTKREWFKKSQYKFIEEGLKDLVKVINQYSIKSIALPPLGCGNGGLKWEKVKPLIENYLEVLADVDVIIFEPNDSIKQLLQKDAKPREGIKLTPGRAMLLDLLYRYEQLGEDASVFSANKLAYFLQTSGENLRLQFVPYSYGPYAQNLEKVLYALNGKYLTGMEQMTARKFEPLKLCWERYEEVQEYINHNLSHDQKQRISNVFKLIQGFESTLSLEILASIHFLQQMYPDHNNLQLLIDIGKWSERKKELITEEYVNIALEHLHQYGNNFERV